MGKGNSHIIFLIVIVLGIVWVNNKDGYSERQNERQEAHSQAVQRSKENARKNAAKIKARANSQVKEKIKSAAKPSSSQEDKVKQVTVFGLTRTAPGVWRYKDGSLAYQQARAYSGAKDYPPAPVETDQQCKYSKQPLKVTVNTNKYPASALHFFLAWKRGAPQTVHIGRDVNIRNVSLAGIPTKPDFDRDEVALNATWEAQYDAAVAKKKKPVVGLSDIAWIPYSDNRGSGSSIGAQIRGYCTGQAFKILLVG